MFTLLACVQKQLSLNRKLYVAFVDFEKCFDSINRNLLWKVLIKNGVKGKLLRCLRSMYCNVRARVRGGSSELSQSIACTKGVKQGDVCSPLLCSLFINELAVEIINNGRHGVSFIVDTFQLFILLLADDVVLLSETIVGLQTQLNNLQRASSTLSLKVNLDKTDIVVFRKGGYLAGRERWVYDGKEIAVVNAYRYLGIYFSTRLSFTTACRDIASKAKRALLLMLQRLRTYNNQSVNIFFKLFDARIQPIMQYGSEIWGFDEAAQECEKVHLYALKRFLYVDRRTPNDLVYCELQRYPITINSFVSCIRYWLKIMYMDAHRLPNKAYFMLKHLDEKGKRTWVTNIRTCLFQNGFGLVWQNQGVGNSKQFLQIFKRRMIDSRWQVCNAHVEESERFSMYASFRILYAIPVYLQLNIPTKFKFIMSKFRFGCSDIAVHYYRYRVYSQRDLLCKIFKTTVENEVHFVLCCKQLQGLRNIYIAPKFYRNPSAFHLSLLFCSMNETVVRALCIFFI